jgi:hypothetical protein
LTDEEQRAYQQAQGKYLSQYLDARTADPSWQRKSPAAQKAIIDEYVTAARSRAQADVLKTIPSEERNRRRQEALRKKAA